VLLLGDESAGRVTCAYIPGDRLILLTIHRSLCGDRGSPPPFRQNRHD